MTDAEIKAANQAKGRYFAKIERVGIREVTVGMGIDFDAGYSEGLKVRDGGMALLKEIDTLLVGCIAYFARGGMLNGEAKMLFDRAQALKSPAEGNDAPHKGFKESHCDVEAPLMAVNEAVNGKPAEGKIETCNPYPWRPDTLTVKPAESAAECVRCKDWQRQGLSLTCPDCDKPAEGRGLVDRLKKFTSSAGLRKRYPDEVHAMTEAAAELSDLRTRNEKLREALINIRDGKGRLFAWPGEEIARDAIRKDDERNGK